MAIKKSPETGRKAAYVARNRAALIKSAQAIFAELGGAATIEEVAAHAEVAVSTVYKHFETSLPAMINIFLRLKQKAGFV